MKQIPIKEFAKEKGQRNAATLLGLTQGALSKALRLERQIHVRLNDDGTYSAEEVKPFPSPSLRRSSL
ncbi:hypothetical protein PHLH8_25010 [Pseudomonas sp. Pc102]|uniref:Cro/CI family transcriptional regulator n=1 Tax=Pseudomonas sp. Pc102 TaxID=2678261 RepID=UPI001BD10826|nr:Cro/CI family transcriptional regulator [Pseudomonas sp. Pc102]BBP82859.1 hypothetical protein PHLH8_25010 [Pseudomonas sp. Pc102]